MIASVESNVAPFGTFENIDESIRHAEVKSGALKNTQVTLMKKKVIKASKKFEDRISLKNPWNTAACTTTGLAEGGSGNFLFIILSR